MVKEGKVAASPVWFAPRKLTMRRAFLCLPLCFLCISDSSSTEPPTAASFREVADTGKPLPSDAEMERLARNDPIAFLETCIQRYDREVKGYSAELVKQERIEGRLERREITEVFFREEPFSVLMRWKEGARKAAATLYVKGENRDQLLVQPAGIFSAVGIVTRDPNGSDAKKSSRYSLPEFGIKIGMQRTLASWKRADEGNALHVEFLGVKKIQELGGRSCWVLKRTNYAKPEEDGITGLTTYIDKENWLQVGTTLKDGQNRLIGEYYFRDVKPNPDFPADMFKRNTLKR
jgi:hypothetical protein